MYFEPLKKTYRFPSVNKINDFDTRYYFPEKSGTSKDDSRFETSLTSHVPETEHFHDL